ncbi:YdcF family protein [Neobacillus sp. PS3-40]|uniref:YdcF family protein n=1 Tax=Neobacillus sp. PS3-40 TaxID=3070679 RepID=UPI0027DF0AC8|nr:YdcF family protein [Neobacillus sp. PS3-40]WML44227.1 YdcF family protein [Neobacillus sp. PS3-40]
MEKVKKGTFKKRMVLTLSIVSAIGLIYIGILQFKIYQYSHKEVPKNASYLIILGARVKGTIPSLALKSRINAATKYLEVNKDTIVIASGGKGPGEKISEAESIKKELLKRNINESRILMENRSTDTYENIKFSKAFIPKTAKVGVVVTNGFHVYRSIIIGKNQNLNLEGLPAKTPKQVLVQLYIREYLALTKYFLTR